MEKIIIFGAGLYSKGIAKKALKNNVNSTIVAFIDNDKDKQGRFYEIDNNLSVEICSIDILNKIDYDKIIIATYTGYNEVVKQLISLGVNFSKIDASAVEISIKARETFCYDFATVAREENLNGDVAEIGVFRGDFAQHINKAFHDKKFYLFDTFEGFDESELKNDPAYKNFKNLNISHFANTSEELVLSKMTFKENCIIKKGFFPDTAVGLENNKFIFTNLDCDLYEPILAGLKFFVPRTVSGGVVLVHDYFNEGDCYIGVKKAIDEFRIFAKENNLNIVIAPIGDSISIAVFKI